MKKQLILNSMGKPVQLEAEDKRRALLLEKKIKNDLGYNIPVTTLTEIMAKISEQKFFEVAPADFFPVKVGNGAWSDRILQFRSQGLADDFSTGIINTASNNGRLAGADAGIESVSNPIYNWAKDIGWTLFDLKLAAKAGNWDIVEAKERARKKNWDLGIQKVAFLGLSGVAAMPGLLNQTGVTNNTTLITEPISGMTSAELSAFLGGLLAAYRSNTARTTWPNRFVIPESDYLGLAVPTSLDFPMKSKLQVLEETLRILTKNPDFKVLPLSYADNSVSGLGVQRYALYNADEDSLYMNVPVDYTSTSANTVNGFQFQNVAYGQFGGVFANRPLELMYFSY